MSTPVFMRLIHGTNSARAIPFKAHNINEFSPDILESYYEDIYASAILILNNLEHQSTHSDLFVVNVTIINVQQELIVCVSDDIVLLTVEQVAMHIDSETKLNYVQHTREPQSLQNKPNRLSLIPGPLYLINALLSFLINIPVMNAVWKERRDLELLTIEHMRDIGLNPAHVQQECRKSFFDIPSNRKRSMIVLEEKSDKRAF